MALEGIRHAALTVVSRGGRQSSEHAIIPILKLETYSHRLYHLTN